MTDEEIIERVPPSNLEAERCVLGSCLRQNAVFDDVCLIVGPDDFYSDAHQKIVQAMLARWAKGGPVDLVILADALKAAGQIDDIGGYSYLAGLWDAAPTAANAEHYAKIVREKAIARSLVHAGMEITRTGYDPSSPSEELLEKAEETIFAIADRRMQVASVALAQAVGHTFDCIDSRARSGASDGVPSGFEKLDELTTGFRPGSLVIVAARPSVGKTAFASALAIGACRGDKPSLFISLEQTYPELVERMLCAEAQVNSHKVRKGWLSQMDVSDLHAAGEKLKQLRMFIDDAHSQSVHRIAALARRHRRRHGIEALFIDYLQLIVPDNRRTAREQQVAEIAQRLKHLARELGIPVICLAQLNRDSEKRAGHVPILADLRESGAIEQEADMVMLLHRPDIYGDGEDREGEVDVIVAKHRNGMTGTITLAFSKQYMRFASRTVDVEQRNFSEAH